MKTQGRKCKRCAELERQLAEAEHKLRRQEEKLAPVTGVINQLRDIIEQQAEDERAALIAQRNALAQQVAQLKQERDDCARAIVNGVIDILRRDPRFPRLTLYEYELIFADVERDDRQWRGWLEWQAAYARREAARRAASTGGAP